MIIQIRQFIFIMKIIVIVKVVSLLNWAQKGLLRRGIITQKWKYMYLEFEQVFLLMHWTFIRYRKQSQNLFSATHSFVIFVLSAHRAIWYPIVNMTNTIWNRMLLCVQLYQILEHNSKKNRNSKSVYYTKAISSQLMNSVVSLHLTHTYHRDSYTWPHVVRAS